MPSKQTKVTVAKRKKARLSVTEQHARFVEAAKKAEADESSDAMEKAFKRLSLRKKSRGT